MMIRFKAQIKVLIKWSYYQACIYALAEQAVNMILGRKGEDMA